MTYRNDHDAALHRIDALEAELAHLRTPTLPAALTPSPPTRTVSRPFVIVVASLALMSAAVAKLLPNTDASEPSDVAVRPPTAQGLTANDLVALASCRDAIAPSPHLDATSTNPRNPARVSVHSILPTAAPCRDALASAASRATGERRAALRAWLRAEDELVGAITRTIIYYESDPFAADTYRSAPQLWREYDRAIDVRDAALENVDLRY